MKEKMRAALTALTEAVGQLEDLVQEAHDAESEQLLALQTLGKMAETLLDAAQDISRVVLTEVEMGKEGNP